MERIGHEALIAGIGQTNYRRRQDIPLGKLIAQATKAALADASIKASDLDTVFTEASTSPTSYPIDRFTSALGFGDVAHHGYFGTGGSGLFYATLQAATLIRSGLSKGAIIYFGLDWGSQPSGPYGYHERFPAKKHWEVPFGFYGQPIYYGAMARRYQAEYGIRTEDLEEGLAAFAISSRENALKNPTSQTSTSIDRKAYAESRLIADPLRIFDCCLVSDGAAALILLPADRVDARGVKVISGAYRQESTDEEGFFSQSAGYLRLPAAQKASKAAFATAGIAGAQDADFVNVYDCFTISALLQLEAIGWCEPGQSVFACRNGATQCDGHTPVNTHGGLLSNGYLLGFNHLIEAVRQLRGEAGDGQVSDARVGIVTASPARHHTTLVLGRA